MTDFLKKAFEKGRVKPVEEAFKENPVEEENHQGRLDYYLREDEKIYDVIKKQTNAVRRLF